MVVRDANTRTDGGLYSLISMALTATDRGSGLDTCTINRVYRRTIHADNETTIGIQRSDQRLIIAMPVTTTTAPAIRRAR